MVKPTWYFFQKNAQKPGQPYEPLALQGGLYPDCLELTSGGVIHSNFDIRHFKFGDIIFCEIDLESMTITPIPWEVPEGNPLLDPIILAAIDAESTFLTEGAKNLKIAAQQIYGAIKSSNITETLIQNWANTRDQWVNAVISRVLSPERVQVNFTSVPPIMFPVELRVSPHQSSPAVKLKAFEDSGSGPNLISPAKVRQLGLIPGRKVVVEGITPEETVTTQVVSVHVTLAPGVAKTFEALMYPSLRKKTSADFLAGREIIRFGRAAGVKGL